MNNCAVCDGCFRNDNPDKVICDGICRQSFHAECANFSKNALLCYREMPNLQWFCDGCIMQIRSSNVTSPFNNFNSAVVFPTSSPSYVQRSFINAKRNRNSYPNVKPKENPVLLATGSPKFEHGNRKVNSSMCNSSSVNEMQPKNCLVKSPGTNGSIQTTSVINKADADHPKPQQNSFAEVLTKSSTAESTPIEVKDSTIQPQNDLMKPQRIASPRSETFKVAYVSNFHPSVTEEEVVEYLLQNNIIASVEDVLCKKLVSPNVNIDSVSFVSFKITCNFEIFRSVVNSELWPEKVVVREFVKR